MKPHDFDYHWTLAHHIDWQGVGLHSGQRGRLSLLPHHQPGFFLKSQGQYFPLNPDAVSQTRYCTSLQLGTVTVQTVEHLLAALMGLGISAAQLELDGPEIPILDGSALLFAQAIQAAGIQPLPQERTFFRPEPGQWESKNTSLHWEPADQLEIEYGIDYTGPPALAQNYRFVWSPEAFMSDIAGARTFVYLNEVAQLQAAGLAQGGSRDNALVIENHVPAADWRWPDEPVRHKILDLIGDLALSGAFPLARIKAYRTGHEAHVTMVKSWHGNWHGKTSSGR
ncbi:MAG: UDP-3-O-[3-hydroxymyristoyl] N-acetylglucosamine deacetylase [Candidatus Sericytochromatia bacterium]|nr:UDP-3-O-[3-hydroxymyristoyl] N-acetylglucosamine deacetylase [Candidatus Sericytochromatia bacterium]